MIEHIAVEDLAAYADGALKGEARNAAEAHLCRCRECREELAGVVELTASPDKVPGEFLQKALDASSAGRRTLNVPARVALPLRPAFGIAAVFLVAVVVAGFFFLGRGRMPKGVLQDVKAKDERVVRKEREEGRNQDQGAALAARALQEKPLPERDLSAPSREGQPEAASAPELEKKNAVQADEERLPSLPPARQATAPVSKEARPTTDQAVTAELQETAKGVGGGVEAAAEKDKSNEAKPSASAAALPAGVEARKKERAEPLASAADTKASWSGQIQRRQVRHGPNVEELANAATQILMAVNGQVSAPLVIQAAGPLSDIRIAGDVGLDEVLDLRQLHALHAFPWGPGTAMELEIATDGAVVAVTLLGDWEPAARTPAAAAARKLRFSASQRQVRRALLRLHREPN